MAEGDIATQDPSKQVFKIKVKGQEKEVTQDELIRLAQQGDDYAQNTEALKKKEEALKAEEAKVSGLKAIVDEMESDPKLKETLNKVYSDFKSGKLAKSDETKDKDSKLLDELIEESSDPAEIRQLKRIRTIISQEAISPKELEELGFKSLKEAFQYFKNNMAEIKNATLIGQTDRVESQLTKLEEKFGVDLVGKYKKDITTMSLKYPAQSVQKLLYHLADDSEIEAAILSQAKKKEKDEIDKKKKASSPSGGEPSFIAKTELQKDKAGRTSWSSVAARVQERLGRR